MTKSIKFTLTTIAILLTLNIFANVAANPPGDYEKLWKQVESFKNDALPQSALKVVEQIYALAVSENNEKEMIKAIVHKMSYTKTLDEAGAKTAIQTLESEMTKYSGIVKPFMHLFLATMYDEYLNSNSYLIEQRSVTAGFTTPDMDAWDKTKFQDKIVKNYLLSMNDILKKQDIAEYPDFIENVKESGITFPTLFDFVAYHAINKLGGNNYYFYGSRNDNDKLRDNAYLSEIKAFVKLQVLGDTLSYKNTSLKIFQKWLQFRLENPGNTEALVNTDLLRLNFVKDNLATADKDQVWENAMIALQKKYNNIPELTQVNYELAGYYNELGASYNFQDSTTLQYKMHKVKAMGFLNDVIKRFPDAKYTPACINLKNEIEKIDFSFEVENIVNANEKYPLRITYRNTDEVYMTIIKCDYDNFLDISERQSFEKYLPELIIKSTKVVDAKLLTLPKTTDYNSHYTEYLTDPLSYGFYVILLHAKKELQIDNNYFAYSQLFASDLSMVTKGYNNSNAELYILNRKTGQPVENAKVEFYLREHNYQTGKSIYKKSVTVHTDKNGYAKVTTQQGDRWSNNYRVDVTYKEDFISHNSYFYTRATQKDQSRTEIKIFTDRAIYRPGQTVHFKAICLETRGDEVKILPEFSTRVDFKDANWQNLETRNLMTNEYGTFSGSFTIPLGTLTGNFTLYTSQGTHNIKVEEYKRPMFEVNMLPVEGEYKINDKVTAEGVAVTYAGTALTDAKVNYSVTRTPLWRPWGWFYRNSAPVEIAFGEVTLDKEGKFKIDFKAAVDEIETLKQYVAYNYTVNVTVTDINGETQTGATSVLVSNRALEVSSDLKTCLLREQMDSITITTQNVSGVFVPAKVEVQVFKLKDTEVLLSKKSWGEIDMPFYSKEEWYKQYPGHEYNDETNFSKFEIEKSVFKKQINTSNVKKIKFDDVAKWSSGVYRMVLKTVDKWGNPVEEVKEFVLFSEKDTKLPYKATDLFYVDKTSAQPGEIVTVYVGSSYKDAHLFYDLGVKGKAVKTETLKLSSEIIKIKIPIEEAHRGDIAFKLFFVKDGRTYEHEQTITVDWENKKLDIKFVTFRDKTLPGANESWQLKISDKLSKPAQAEFMAAMYDASLDIFAKNSWSLNPFPRYNFNINWGAISFNSTSSMQTNKNFYKVPLTFYIVNPSLILFNPYSSYGMYRKSTRLGGTAEGAFISIADVAGSEDSDGIDIAELQSSSQQTVGNKSEQFFIFDKDDMTSECSVVGGGEAETPAPSVQIRQNFSETAFFYPTLTTNEAGDVFVNFTMPESLTRWNFMGLAHTKDLKIGTINESIVTQKELMVMPNLPRFFRENDKMTISAKINCIAEMGVSGIARIEFFDVETLKSLNDKFLNSETNEVVFTVLKNENKVVEWKISIPEGLSAVGVRIIADGRNHSDGEERILPVLSNKMLVTESMPLPVRKAGTTNFKFNSLLNNASSKTLRHESYTLEFTANPAWYAVQALPYLMEYPHECAEQVFSRFYANTLSSHIANSDPKIKRIFELWKAIPESKALLSNLEKNQELKALMIEETPWLLNAKNESERKRNLGILFDLNRMAMENNTAVKKLSEMQLANGGFPWFKGMSESWYITQHIVGGFAHLDKLAVTEIRNNPTVWNMLKKSITYLDKQLEKSYEDLKKYCKDKCLQEDNLSYMQIHYLYVRSFFIQDVPVSESAKAAFDYYKNQAVKYWTKKSFYMQGMIALSLYKYGEPKVPAKIVASLKEHALSSEEMGTYWKYNSGCFWYQAPIETQALLIEVFSDVANDQKWVDEMKVWLLKQKQTQDWKTTKATTEAIYALLLQGADLLTETDYPVIKIGDMTLDVAADPEIKTEAGTGYFKKRWDGVSVTPDWSNVSVTKNANSVAWGAVYWQYFEQLDKIKQFEETPLTINKQLFVERRSGDKTVIVPIDNVETHNKVEMHNYASIQIGDKITVRIEIRTDRDMEYVHLKDMRAACFEPTDYLSGYKYKAGFGYYQSIKDASMNFFIDYLRKGTYVFEYTLRVSQKGEFSNGITTIQSMYAPEFTSHSEGVRVRVGE